MPEKKRKQPLNVQIITHWNPQDLFRIICIYCIGCTFFLTYLPLVFTYSLHFIDALCRVIVCATVISWSEFCPLWISRGKVSLFSLRHFWYSRHTGRPTRKVLKAHAQHRPTSVEGFSMACCRITGPIRAFRSPYHLSVRARPCSQQHPGTETQNRQMTHKTIHTDGIHHVQALTDTVRSKTLNSQSRTISIFNHPRIKTKPKQ